MIDILRSVDRRTAIVGGAFTCGLAWAAGTLVGSFFMADPGSNLGEVATVFYESAKFYASFRCCNLPLLILSVGSWLYYSRKAWQQRVRDIVVLIIIAVLSLIGGFLSGGLVIVEWYCC